MIDEHDLETRLESIFGRLNLDNCEVSHILSLLPIGVSIATDVTCHEIRHNPTAAQFFRIPAWLSSSSQVNNIAPFQVFRKGKEIFYDEMPLQRAAWFGESTWEDELEYVWQDGTRKTSVWNARPLYGTDGTINGAIGVYEDITSRKKLYNRIKTHGKKLREMLQERTEQLGRARQKFEEEMNRHSHTERCLSVAKDAIAKVFQYSPDSISISTLEEGRYIEVNSAYTILSGYENNEVIGCTGKELGVWVYPDERDVMLKNIHTNGTVTNYEIHFRTKSGQIRICLVSGGTIDINGEPHLICVIKDITERKQVEEELSISEERFSKAFNFSPYPMCISTLNEGRLIEVNESFCRTTGYSSAELLGQSVLEIGLWLNPEDRRLVTDLVTKEGSVRDYETIFRTRNGEYRAFIYNAEKIEIQDTSCIFSVVMDVTEKKKIEADMLRLDRLNLAGEMATSIGHEIRNPMTTVRGYLQLLAEDEKYGPEVEYFDLMIEELDRANLIITEFVSLAKNKLVELRPTNINYIINQLLPFMQAKALRRNQQIRVDLVHLADLLLDDKEIRQLLLNLVQNGMESMPAGGKITVKTYLDRKNQILMVKDEGYGIKNQDIGKVGTPFFTTKENGTGLGLAVCYRIAAHHNAKIEFETSSSGTTFYVKFPLP